MLACHTTGQIEADDADCDHGEACKDDEFTACEPP